MARLSLVLSSVLAGLQRRNVDPHRGTITIDPDIGELHEPSHTAWLGPPKTAATVRTIALPRFLADLLREHLAQIDGPFVFHRPRRLPSAAQRLQPTRAAPGRRRRCPPRLGSDPTRPSPATSTRPTTTARPKATETSTRQPPSPHNTAIFVRHALVDVHTVRMVL